MNPDEAFSDHLIHQVAEGLLDEEGRFRVDHSLLKRHYEALVSNEHEAVSYFMKSAERWESAKFESELKGSRLRIEIEYPENCPIPQRLGEEPSYRLSAIFQSNHYLHELAAGYNGLAFSKKTRDLSLDFLSNTLVLECRFVSDATL